MNLSELTFGWRSAVLLCAMLVILPIAAALWRNFDNRAANRTMAVLLAVLAGVFTPWLIGFAGFYDQWPWLSFLPVAQPLFVPPLLLAYVALTTGGASLASLRLWFLPGLAMALYETASFLLPLKLKLAWADFSAGLSSAIESVLLVLLFLIALAKSRALVETYRQKLADQRSDGPKFALSWLVRLIAAMTILWSLWAGYAIASTFLKVSYEGYLPLYLAIAATSVWLAVEAWRHAQLSWPVLKPIAAVAETGGKAERDWKAEGERWARALEQAEAFRDPGLTLRRAARIAGTNEAYLSRALNEGLAMSFSALIQRLRSEAVAAAIDRGAGEDLLTLAHDAGFASKASFNRAFSARFGVPPSVYRKRLKSVKSASDPTR